MNTEPSPFFDFTEMVPFIISTMFLVIAMPSPVEPNLFLRLESSWVKESNTFGIKDSSMPIPVSFTSNFRVLWSSNWATLEMVRVMLPGASVNLMALLKMLMNTCLSFMSSPIK